MKGATENAYFNMVNQQNINPRSHEGSDIDCLNVLSWFVISIHAPMKGATLESCTEDKEKEFQSTLP